MPLLLSIARAVFILIIGLLMTFIAIVVGAPNLTWDGAWLVQVSAALLVACATVAFMPVRVPGMAAQSLDSKPSSRVSVPIVAAASIAGATLAPVIAGAGILYFLLAIFGGWLVGLGVKVCFVSVASRERVDLGESRPPAK